MSYHLYQVVIIALPYVITSLKIHPIPYLLQEVVKRDGTMVSMTQFPICLVK